MNEIKGEKAYPIYNFSAKWSQDITDKDKDPHPNWLKDLPKGRMWNSSSFSKMFKDENENELDEISDRFKAELFNNPKYKNIKDLNVESKFKEYETWKLSWFCHETFRDKFMISNGFDLDFSLVLDSFEKFVQRKEILMHRSKMESELGLATITLMGAEDRWRWRGEHDDDPAPCRCNGCFKSGMIRINH